MMESAITEQLSTARMKDGDRLAVSYADATKLADEVSDFVNRGIRRNQITLMLITREEAEGIKPSSEIPASKWTN